MSNLNRSPNFDKQIDKLEQELEELYNQNAEKFPNQSEKQAESFLNALSQKIKGLFEEIAEEDKPAFAEYIRQELNLKTDADIKNFSSLVQVQMEDLINDAFSLKQ